MPDPGQTAYEARFNEEDRRKRYANEWARLGPEERALWARVEAASASAGSVIEGEDRIAAALRAINVGVLQIRADATERIAKAIAVIQPDVKTDPPPRDGFDELVTAARAEAASAMLKFPQPNYVISKIAEEAGEVVKAAIHCAEGRESYDAVHSEMRQLIAMLYRLWVEGDGVHGLQPVCPRRLLPPLPPAPETQS